MANRFQSIAVAALAVGTLLTLANPSVASVLNRKTGGLVAAGGDQAAPSKPQQQLAAPAGSADSQATPATAAQGTKDQNPKAGI